MTKKHTLKHLLTEDVDMDFFQSILDPSTGVTDQHKQKFMDMVKEFNTLSSSVYRNISLKEITKKINIIGKLSEQFIVNESDDWFDKVSLKKDAKEIQDSAEMFEKTAKEMAGLQSRLEMCFENLGTRLSRYFSIEDLEEKTDTNTLS
jgi:hypothetical protein